MAEQIFRSPGFFEREVDLTERESSIRGIPAGIIGTSERGPAFVPVTFGSFIDFQQKFGNLNKDQFGPYAVKEWLKNRTAVTYIRVLGAGYGIKNQTTEIVNNAGFVITGSDATDGRLNGSVQFIAGLHTLNSNEADGYPIYTDNQSFDSSTDLKIVRAMIFMASGAKLEILNHDEFYSVSNAADDSASISEYNGTESEGTFKLVLSSTLGSSFGNDESKSGLKIYTASLDPNSNFYIGKFLNTNPDMFSQEQHLLYADFPVESELAKVKYESANSTVGILSGSHDASTKSGMSFNSIFGKFNTRYRAAKSTPFISQPFGEKEYDLFHFESLDDGSVSNKRVKISITNLKKSTNPSNPYGEFTVLIRDYNDSDSGIKILEQFTNCNLNPLDEKYIANMIGDYKVYYNHDSSFDDERRLEVSGKRPNRSKYVRIVMNQQVEDGLIPKNSLPFGFRGLPVLNTNDYLNDESVTALPEGSSQLRLDYIKGATTQATQELSSSIVPPVPMRFKVTKGAIKTNGDYLGQPGDIELSDPKLFWGIQFERIPFAKDISSAALQPNAGRTNNKLIDAYTSFLGLIGTDALTADSAADAFNNNKFSLSKVALFNQFSLSSNITTKDALNSILTGSASDHMREAAYIRNGKNESKNYTISESGLNRLTFASLLAAKESKHFNKFTDYLKFTNVLYGGFDGLNILDKDQRLMNDIASSTVSGGKAAVGAGNFPFENLSSLSSPGTGKQNNIVNSYREAAKIMTDPFSSRVNIIAVPGIRDSFITDHVGELTREYSKALYLMDIPSYTKTGDRIYRSSGKVNVDRTISEFDARSIDNNYIATYFPDVIFEDDYNRSTVEAPSSIAALKALGYNDSVSYPWFAPAGFNRGALSNVLNSKVRLNTEDRNNLYDARINPIATFPNGGFVIFGQKTLQQDRSSLDRVNVRRMVIEVKRIVSDVAQKLIFEQNTPQTRARFVADVTPLLASIQSNQGIDQFKVVMDSSNNSDEDAQQNKLNGRIVLVPTRAVEFIAIDFIVTNSGVSFV